MAKPGLDRKLTFKRQTTFSKLHNEMAQSTFKKNRDVNYLKNKFAEMTNLDGQVAFMDVEGGDKDMGHS